MSSIEVRDRSIKGRLTRSRTIIPEDDNAYGVKMARGKYRYYRLANNVEGFNSRGRIYKKPDGSVEAFIAVVLFHGDRGYPLLEEPRAITLTITPEQLQQGFRLPPPYENLEVKNTREGTFSSLRRKLSKRSQ